MNKLKTIFTAGVPFEWDDLAWMQDSIRDAFYGLLSSLGIDPEDSFILSGCQVTIGPSSASTTDGYISLSGEILKVSAHSIAYDGSSPVVWRLQETDDLSGSETDSNGSTVQCYQKRVAVLVQASSYTNEMPYNALNLIDKINELTGVSDGWTSVPYNAAYFSGTNLVMDGANTKLYYKVIGKTMHIAFTLSVTSMDSSTLDINLAAATGYSITKSLQATAIRKMSANNGPVLAMALSSNPYANYIKLTEYAGNLAALSSAVIYGQMTLEVAVI